MTASSAAAAKAALEAQAAHRRALLALARHEPAVREAPEWAALMATSRAASDAVRALADAAGAVTAEPADPEDVDELVRLAWDR